MPGQRVTLCFAILLFVSVVRPGVTALAQFEPRAGFDFPGNANSMAVADFNHDGIEDLAVASVTATNQVQVFLGKGDGTFLPPVTYTVGLDPSPVAAIDLNHDGNIDLVVGNYTNSNISVLLGNGDGTFQNAMTFATPPGPVDLTFGDFNGDGKVDVATVDWADSNTYCGCVSVLLGNGDGTFQEPAIVTSLPVLPLSLGAGYFNADRNLDLAVPEMFGTVSQVQILLGNGDGTFQLGAAYPVGPYSQSVVTADFNKDHKTDLAVAEFEGIGVAVFIGNGDGTFQPAVEYRVIFPETVVARDMNGDGKLDLVTANNPLVNVGGASILYGKGDGTFRPAETFLVPGGFTFDAVVGDFNGDGKPDIAIANRGVEILLNTGVVAFTPPRPVLFKQQKIGTTSAPRTVKLTNTGKVALTISSITAKGPFGVTSTCGSSVAAGGDCGISVTFSPKIYGPSSGLVTIIDSASSKPQIIELSGTGTT